MVNFKMIIYSDKLESYEEFISVCKNFFNNIVCKNNSVEFLREIVSSKNALTIIFIEKEIINKISESLSVLLKAENFFCVLFSRDDPSDGEYKDFINDYLQCSDRIKIENFLRRLNRNMYYRVKLYNNNNMLNKFYDIGKQLSAEKDVNKLLGLITDYSMEISECDAATVYIIIDRKNGQCSFYEKNVNDKLLKFMIARNNSINIELQAATIEISGKSIIGASVIEGKPIRIEDAYNIPEDAGYKFNRNFDKITGYRTQSVLTIPMKDHEDRIIGVIQLINKKENGIVVPFNSSDESMIYSLTGQAAVVLENNMLYNDLNELLKKNKDKIIEEITKRKNADEEIKKLLSVVEHSPISVIITDTAGRIQYVNLGFEKLTGYSYSEVSGKNPRILKSNFHGKEYYENLWSVILKGVEWKGELLDKKKNGENYWANSYITPVKNEKGEIEYFIALQEDNTEKKKLLVELEEKNTNLQYAIEKLNQSQMQVIQSEKLAGIGQLAAGVAHEINTPLGYVINNLKSLEKYSLTMSSLISLYRNLTNSLNNHNDNESMLQEIYDYEKNNKVNFIIEDMEEVLKESREGLSRVSEIIKALRLFSTVDQLDGIQDYNLNENVINTITILKSEIGNINLKKDLRTIPLIKAETKEMNQVILNLIKNSVYAIKSRFEDESKGVIIIRTDSNSKAVFMEIEDNGTGIEEKYLNKIFEPFFTTKPVGRGAGLGLSIVYDVVVKKYKGEITVSSDYGKGTKFIIKLH